MAPASASKPAASMARASEQSAPSGTELAPPPDIFDAQALDLEFWLKPRTLTVTRGVQGSTAASHLISAAIARHVVPPAAHTFAIASALSTLLADGGHEPVALIRNADQEADVVAAGATPQMPFFTTDGLQPNVGVQV